MGNAMVSPNEHSANRASEEQAERKKTKKLCKWGRRATMVSETTARTDHHVNPTSDETLDPALWGELHRYVNLEEMIAANLPLHAFYRSLSVCKKWNALKWNRSFLEQWSKTSLPKPYFILHGDRGCHQAMLVQHANQWVLQQLPSFAFQQSLTSVAHGMVYTGTYEKCIRGTVFNIHTKVFRRLPPLQSDCSPLSSILAVDKHTGAYKVMVSWDQNNTHPSIIGTTHVYDSMTGTWTQSSDSRASARSVVHVGEDYTYCEGVMYIKRETYKLPLTHQALFAYSFEHDFWAVLARAPHGYARLKGLGEWNGVLRDMTLDDKCVLRVWEFQLTGPEVEIVRNHKRSVKEFQRRHSGDEWVEWRANMPVAVNWQEYEFRRVWVFQQTGREWVEVDCMPASVLQWFLEPYGLHGFLYPPMTKQCIRTSYCEQYVLLSHHGFAENHGLASRLVLYNMALRSWQPLHVAKDWICSCPFSQTYPANWLLDTLDDD